MTHLVCRSLRQIQAFEVKACLQTDGLLMKSHQFLEIFNFNYLTFMKY